MQGVADTPRLRSATLLARVMLYHVIFPLASRPFPINHLGGVRRSR